jgi:hypothetical protein
MAHTWAVHVDVKEYVELLQKIFLRITVKRVTRGSDGSSKVYLPTVAIEIWQRDLSEDEQPWEECADEVQDNDMFEYMDAENEHGGFVKMRRPKQEKKEDNKNLVINGHEPLSFNERVEYFTYSDQASEPTEEDVADHVFAEMRDVYPMGYPTEQFLTKVKNDVNDAFEKLKEQNKKTDDKKGHSTVLQKDRVPNKDPGMIEELGLYYEDEFTMHDHVNGVRIKTICHIRDNIYNQLRTVLKSETNLSIQPHFDWPSRATLSGM